jgi:hypothetical protein
MRLLLLCFFTILYGSHSILLAQVSNNDSVVYRVALDNAASKSLRTQKAINIGIEYRELPYSFENGHQFFLTDKKLNGDIFYNKILYKNQGLQYDLLLDEVIAVHVNGRKIILIKEKITEFTLEGYVFRRFTKATIPNKMIPGFYNVLVEEDGVSVLVKRVKRQKGNGVQFHQQGMAFIEDNTKYYLKKEDGSFSEIKTHKNIVKLLSNNGKKPTIAVTKDMTREERMINVVKQYTRMKNEL